MRNHISLSGGNVARVGDVEYATLPAALNAAQDYDTITLLMDVVLTKTLAVKLNSYWNSNFTLNLNGKTISCNSGETNRIFFSAKLTICDNSSGKAGKVTQNGANAVQIRGGTLIITGGSFGPVSVDSGGSAEINGGSFSEIWAFDISGTAIALSSVLADGYAFYDQTNGEVQNGTATKLTNVTVKKHTHSGSPCACGYTCSHPEMDSTTGKCTGCDELIAQAGHLLLPTVGKSGIIGIYETRRKEHGL